MNRLLIGLLVPVALFLACKGQRPATPSQPAGPEWVRVDTAAEYSVLTTDPEAGDISYRLDWGDEDTSDWTGWFPSGTEVAVKHAWPGSGNRPVRAQARDTRGNLSEWSAGRVVHVLPEPGYPTVPDTTIELGFESGGIVAEPDGQYVFVSARDKPVLAVIRTSDNNVTQMPSVDMSSIAVSPDAQFLYGLGAYLYKLRSSDGAPVDSAEVGGFFAEDLAVTPDGQFLYVDCEDIVSGSVQVWRTSKLEKVAKIVLDDYAHPTCIAFSPDGSYAYVCLADGGAVAVVRTLDNTVTDQIQVGWCPFGIASLPSGDYVYVASNVGRDVSVIRTTDNCMVAAIPVDSELYDPLVSAAPNCEFVYVTSEYGGVSVIETTSNTVVGTIACDAGVGVAPLPDGSRIYALSESGTVTVLGF
jgi:YVTN family beta-propeller protein